MPKQLNSRCQELVASLLTYLEQERDNNGPLLPLTAVREPSLIIMDNAPYHSMLLKKIPNTSWTKAAIQDWPTRNSIEFSTQMLKAELLRIVARNKPERELIWGIAKPYYDKNIGRDGYTKQDCLNMWSEALKSVTPDMWKNAVEHTKKEIMKRYEREHILDLQEDHPPLIINTADDSDSSS